MRDIERVCVCDRERDKDCVTGKNIKETAIKRQKFYLDKRESGSKIIEFVVKNGKDIEEKE